MEFKPEFLASNPNIKLYKFNLNEKHIYKFINDLSLGQSIVLDATGISLHKVRIFLNILRKIWFNLDNWQPFFALIYDDFKLVEIAEELTTTFYSVPELINDGDLNIKIKKIKLNAAILRLCGPGLIINYLHKINNLKRKYFNK